MTHLSDTDLRTWIDNPSAESVISLRSHVASCEPCRTRVAQAIRQTPVTGPMTLRPDDFAAAGLARFQAPARGPRWRMFAIPAAAAALLALAIAFPPLRSTRTAYAPAEGLTRGTSLTALAPAGTVTSVAEFRWSSPVAAATYRIDVRSNRGVIMYTTMTSAERVGLTPGEAGRFTAGEYHWTITALDDQGNIIIESPAETFKVR